MAHSGIGLSLALLRLVWEGLRAVVLWLLGKLRGRGRGRPG